MSVTIVRSWPRIGYSCYSSPVLLIDTIVKVTRRASDCTNSRDGPLWSSVLRASWTVNHGRHVRPGSLEHISMKSCRLCAARRCWPGAGSLRPCFRGRWPCDICPTNYVSYSFGQIPPSAPVIAFDATVSINTALVIHWHLGALSSSEPHCICPAPCPSNSTPTSLRIPGEYSLSDLLGLKSDV